jgi:hypothetical protein
MTDISVGRVDAPLLVVMTSASTEGMESWFWKALLKCGIKKTDTRIVYLLNEQPANKGGNPSVSQLRANWKRFSGEVSSSSPQVVMPMGGHALKYLTGVTEQIFDARGYVVKSDLFRPFEHESYEQVGTYVNNSKATGAKKGDPKMKWVKRAHDPLLGFDFKGIVIPTFTLDHVRVGVPGGSAFAIKPAFDQDTGRASRAIQNKLYMIDENFHYYSDWTTIKTKDGVGYNMPNLTEHQWGDMISIDIETHGVDNEAIDTVQFSDGDVTASLPWTEESRLYVQHLFDLPDRLFVGHNVMNFDIPRLVLNGVTISNEVIEHHVFCSMWGAVVIQPDLHKGLGRATTVYLDVAPWKWSMLKNANMEYYGAKDAFVTWFLAKQEIAVLKKLGVWNLFMGQGNHPGPGVMATIPVLEEMTLGGLRTDRALALYWSHYLERRNLRYEKMWARMFPRINPHSNKDVPALLYGAWGLPVQRSKEDGVTVDELALVKLKAYISNPENRETERGWTTDPRCVPRVFDLLLALRDAKKTLGTYVQPVAIDESTWVHPRYGPISKDDEFGRIRGKSKGNTSTGRLASFKPNIQNQPKKIRALYLPDTDDMTFIQADYKSAELCVMAWESGDRQLLEDLLSGDMHSRNAERFGVSRDTAKNVTYASQYLASAKKVQDMILEQDHIWLPLEVIQRIMDGLVATYPGVTAYKRHLITLCDTKKYIQNSFGRVRCFHDGRAPAAVDFIPQSTVADVLWCVLRDVSLMAKRYGGRLTTTVHDSILIQVPSEWAAAAACEMKQIMERRIDIVKPGFYIPVELEMAPSGKSWSSVKKYVLGV